MQSNDREYELRYGYNIYNYAIACIALFNLLNKLGLKSVPTESSVISSIGG